MRRFTMLIAAGVLFSAGADAAEPTVEAKLALTNLKQLVARTEADPRLERKTVEGLRKLGFESREQVLGAQLADPVKVHMVRLDKLRAYRPGSDNPARLLSAMDAQIYPMRVDKRARASVFIDRGKLSAYGSPRLTQKLEQTRAQLVERTRLPESAFFLVKIPALNARFLGHYQQVRTRSYSSLSKSIYTASPRLVSREALTAPKLLSTKRLMLTALHEVKLPVSDREEGYASLAQGKTLDADAVFRTLLQPARNLDVSVPH